MRPPAVKLLTCAISAAVATVVAFALWRRSEPAETIRLVERTPGGYALLERRAAGGVPSLEPLPGLTLREPVGPEDASLLWATDPHAMEYDPQCYYRYRGNVRMPGGDERYLGAAYEIRTSADGYREDFERRPEAAGGLVVVTGDSHTDGVCANASSFANVVERRLAARLALPVEVLNAGVSGYSFYHYLGVLERHVALEPRAFVVAFYSGNDFSDVLGPWHYFHRTLPPRRSAESWERIRRFTPGHGALLGNLMAPAQYFREHPDQAPIALRAATEVCREIERRCREHGIGLVFVHIPFGGPGDARFEPRLREAQEILGVTSEDLERVRALARDLVAALRAGGARVVDLQEELAGDSGRYYWPDLHIDLEGHERVAERLEPVLAEILGG